MSSATELSSVNITRFKNDWYVKIPKLNKKALFIVVSDHCGYCTQLKSALNNASIPYYYLNGDKNFNVVSQMGIAGYPTIYIVGIDGKLKEHTGSRNPRNLLMALNS